MLRQSIYFRYSYSAMMCILNKTTIASAVVQQSA